MPFLWMLLLQSPAEIERFHKRAGDPDPAVRTRAVDALGRHRTFAAARLLAPLLSDEHPRVRYHAVLALSAFSGDEVVDLLCDRVRNLRHGRSGAIDVLGRLKNPRALQTLIPALQDPTIRADVARALGRIGHREGLDAVRSMDAATPEDRIAQLEALQESSLARKRIDDPSPAVRRRAVEILREPLCADDPDWRVRLAAIREMDDVEQLAGRLEKETGRLQDECRRALCRKLGKDFGVDGRAWIRWWRDEIETPVKPDAPVRFFGMEVPSRRIAFVVDPQRESLDDLRREMGRTIDRLPGETRFTVITIGGKPWDPELVPANEMNKALAVRFLDRHAPRKASNLFDAISKGLATDADTICLHIAGEPTEGVFVSDEDIVEHLRPHGLVKFHITGKPERLVGRLQSLVR